jgi:prepilin-type N-terminal cleavage/methylation domain-containing protein
MRQLGALIAGKKFGERHFYMKQKQQAGFSLIEVIIAMIILLVGILATISALSFSIFSIQDSEQRSVSKEVTRSTLETVFSMRDLLAFNQQAGLASYNWNSIKVKNGSNGGIFLDGWNPIRESPGADGIFGTDDDACSGTGSCVVGASANDSPVLPGYQRKIEIVDIVQNGIVRKRRITVRVRYIIGQLQREESKSTIIADLALA